MKQVSERTVRYPLAVERTPMLEAGRFKDLVVNVCQLFDRLAGLAIVLTMLLVVSNVVMRTLFNRPILGTLEYAGFFTAVAVSFALAYCALENGHIAVNLLVDRLRPSVKTAVELLVYGLSVVFLGACSWGLALYGASSAAGGLVSPTTQTPVYPFVYLVAVGFFAFTLVQLVKLTSCLGKGGKEHE